MHQEFRDCPTTVGLTVTQNFCVLRALCYMRNSSAWQGEMFAHITQWCTEVNIWVTQSIYSPHENPHFSGVQPRVCGRLTPVDMQRELTWAVVIKSVQLLRPFPRAGLANQLGLSPSPPSASVDQATGAVRRTHTSPAVGVLNGAPLPGLGSPQMVKKMRSGLSSHLSTKCVELQSIKSVISGHT